VSSGALYAARVTVLRVGEGDTALLDELGERGAIAAVLRVGDVVDRLDAAVLDEVGTLSRFAWVAVTSANAARRLSLWADHWPTHTRVAVVGGATAAAAAAAGVRTDAVAPLGTAESLATVIDGSPVLFLAAASARVELRDALLARGSVVDTVVAYDVVARQLGARDARTVAQSDVVVAMSPVAIDALQGIAAGEGVAVRQVRLVAIGPTTAGYAHLQGWRVDEMAARRDAASVCEAVERAVGR